MMQRMYGVEMQVPSGKLPGFYAQVIHKIGDHVNVFDRDELLFIVEQEEERDKLIEILSKAQMLGEQFALLHIPAAVSLERIDEVGFVSQSERMYLYAERVALFSLDPQAGDAQDRWAALEQLKEHLIGEIPAGEEPPVYILENTMTELAERIARAYRVSLHWRHHGEANG